MRKIKGIVVAVLSLVMVMSGSITAFAEELPKEPVAVESIASPAPMTMFPSGLYEIKGEGVRLRRTASETGEVIGLLYEEDGAWVMIDGTAVTTGNITWLKVTKSSIGSGGWISSEYIKWN